MNPKTVGEVVQAPRRFWETVWRDDLRAPFRDFISQLFFLALTGVLQVAGRILDLTGMPLWLQHMVTSLFNFLTVEALAVLVIKIGLGIVVSLFRVNKS